MPRPTHLCQLRAEVVAALLAAGAGDQLEAESRIGLRPLHVAANHLRDAVVAQLLELGASVHARSMDGETALCTCVTGLTSRLRDIWTNPDASQQEQAAQVAAATAAATSILRRLLRAGADVNLHFSKDRATPLHFAAQGGPYGPYCDILRMLLQAGADWKAVDVNARTALDVARIGAAVNPRHLPAVQILEAAAGRSAPASTR